MASALSHIRVLDLTRVLAGPWAAQTLADLGAEVIKIEKPDAGDDTRVWGPPFIENADGSKGDAAYFLSANRGKHSVAIDMASPEGQDLIRQLAAKSDVVIENFKVGGLKKYGLDYEGLKAVNPSIIYCSITGFGQTGPYAHRAGYDFMIQGMSGIMSVTGQPDGTPGAEPMKVGVAFADIFTGLYASNGILAALNHRDRTGEGQHIDIALLDSQVAVLANQALNYMVSGTAPGRLGNAHPNIVPYQVFPTADGHIIIAVGNARQFKGLCEAAGIPELADDPRYATNQDRVTARDEVISKIAPAITRHTTAEWIKMLEAVSVPCGPINTIDQTFADDQVKARGLELELERPDGVKTPSLANPIKMSATPVTYAKAAPALGADTDNILGRVLDMDAEAIGSLREKGIIR